MGDRKKMPPPPRGPVKPREKYFVKPGFSMLDWSTLKTRTKDLSGRGSKGVRGITKSEVREHSSIHDCWTIFRGKVYNITPFLHYHPGGVETVMRGAGRDCTALFDKYHPWVSADSLIGNLMLGPLALDMEPDAEEGKGKGQDITVGGGAGFGVEEENGFAEGEKWLRSDTVDEHDEGKAEDKSKG